MPTRAQAAAAALVLATPVAVWCLVGDLSATQFEDLDYLWQAPQVPRTLELVLGIGALLVAVASAVELAGALYQGRVRRQWSATVVPLAVAGAVVGYGGRVVTAGRIGVDFDVVLTIVVAAPLVLALVVAAGWNYLVERRRL